VEEGARCLLVKNIAPAGLDSGSFELRSSGRSFFHVDGNKLWVTTLTTGYAEVFTIDGKGLLARADCMWLTIAIQHHSEHCNSLCERFTAHLVLRYKTNAKRWSRSRL